MPERYAREFRRAVCERLVAGEKVRSLSKGVGVSEQTLYLWKRQALIDAGRAEGVKSFEADELAQAQVAALDVLRLRQLLSTSNAASGSGPRSESGGVLVRQSQTTSRQSCAVPTTFADDDFGYVRWLGAHPAGYIVNCERNPKAVYLVLHRSSCHTISGTPARGETWTAGGYLKICADSIAELEAWARAATGGGVRRCGFCVP